MVGDKVIFKLDDSQVTALTEYPAVVQVERDGQFADLIVEGTDHEGASPFRVSCVPYHKNVYRNSASWRLEGEKLYDRAAAEADRLQQIKRAEQQKRFVSAVRPVTV